MLYLVIAEVKGPPPAPSLAALEDGEATLARLLELQAEGVVEGAGVFSGRMGMCFRIDVPSNAALHTTVAALPSFGQAEWQVIPLLSLEEDLAITCGAIAHFRDG